MYSSFLEQNNYKWTRGLSLTMRHDALEVWNDTLSTRSLSTRHLYRQHFMKFLEWCGLSANEIRQLKLEEEESEKPWQRVDVENRVRRYLEYLEGEGQAGSSRRSVLTAIRSFFKAQQLPLRLDRQDYPDCAYMNASSVPTREDVKKLADAALHVRDRAVILFLKDSGLRQSDLPQIRWKDLRELPGGFLGFTILTKKKHVKARGFVGPETVDVLEIYRRSRLQGTQKLPPEENILEHPVFAKLTDGSQSLLPKTMSTRIGECVERAGLKGKGLRPHGLRKYWSQNVHVEKPSYQKQMNGRMLDAVEKAYEWKTVEELFHIYRENYVSLRLEKSVSEEVEGLRKEHREEIELLKDRIRTLTEMFERAMVAPKISPSMSREQVLELIRTNVVEELRKRGLSEKYIGDM